MKKMNNKSGFTLIEIIVVMIIVGVLAAIALPNLFSNVTRGQASTAIAAMDAWKSGIEACAMQQGIYPTAAACINAPVPPVTNGFTFSLVPTAAAAVGQGAATGAQIATGGTPAGSNLAYALKATDGTNSIFLNRSTTGTFTCSAPNAGVDAGVC